MGILAKHSSEKSNAPHMLRDHRFPSGLTLIDELGCSTLKGPLRELLCVVPLRVLSRKNIIETNVANFRVGDS